jgi:Lysyl oxidase
VRRGRTVLVLAALLAAAVATARVAPAGSAPAPAPVLPDLDQAPPTRISVVSVRRRGRTLRRLVFASAVENRGAGDLVLVARRPSRRVNLMTADQLVERVDASGRTVSEDRVAGVGHLRYVRLRDHAHWHLIGFERYELRSALTGHLAARDRKSGFCVGNRYAATRAARASGVGADDFDENCGRGRPGLLRVVEGLSPGWGDDYKPELEGQFIDVTSVPAGRYLLVHRTNVEGRLRETRRDNDSASVLLSLGRRGNAAPDVKVLRTCPDRPTCG